MGFDLMKIPTKIKRYCLSHTRKGKVDKLEQLTKSLTQNTALVTRKYVELTVVETEVADALEKLRSETYETENKAIMNLNLLGDAEKKKFMGALVKIRETGIKELEPISETAQRIKAHMLITLNKAQIQKAVLLSKSKLAGNAHLQLETLRIIEKETKNLNVELSSLLTELDLLNEGAIDKFSDFKKDVKGMIGDEDIDIISHITKKLEQVDSQAEKLRKKEALIEEEIKK